ncbi:MAG: hypothetical protein B7733_00470 [Myxococcales bacterium FL481]|nr:MAG: hypothetical protein B7733_00470 [Myxococcales bacterium FL481]
MPSLPRPFRSESSVRSAWLIGALALFAATLATTVPTISAGAQHANRLALAVAAIALAAVAVVANGRWPARDWRRWLLSLALGAACVTGVFNYYRFDAKRFVDIDGHADVTYYYLNSKYFDELGYYELYPAMLVADRDHRHRLDHITRFRDLNTYRNVPVHHAFERADDIRTRFTDDRWRGFQHDLDFFLKTGTRGGWDYFLKDHGYNAPPTWTVVGQRLSSWVPVEYVAWITHVDTALMLAAFSAVAVTFGLQPMAFCLLFYVSTASGKWPVLGSSLLRFDWLAALIGAACAWRSRRPRLAGGLVAYAACNRIFPAVFLFPWCIGAAAHVLRHRRIAADDRRVVVGAVATVGLLVAGALLTQGATAFVDAAQNLLLHNSAKSYSSYRVGLGDALLFAGERDRGQIIGGIPAKEAQLAGLKPTLHAIGLVTVVWIATYIVQRRPAPHAAMVLGFFPFFALTTPQINYFNVRILLVLWHITSLSQPRHAFGLTALFAIEAMAAATQVGGAIAYTWTSMTSVGLTVYCAAMLSWLARDAWRNEPPGDDAVDTRSPWPAAASIGIAVALAGTVFAAYWTAQRVPPPTRRIDLDQLATVQRPGAAWNGPGTVRLDRSGVAIDLGRISRATTLELSFDNNDRYLVRYLHGAREIASHTLQREPNDPRKGLAVRRTETPAAATRSGFDRIEVIPHGGDGRYSLGHLSLSAEPSR